MAILKASRTSMGMDASPVDMSNIVTFCDRMVKLAEYRRDLNAYMVDKVNMASMKICCLNPSSFQICASITDGRYRPSLFDGPDGYRCSESCCPHWGHCGSAFNIEGWVLDVVGEMSSVDNPGSGSRKGTLNIIYIYIFIYSIRTRKETFLAPQIV